MKPKFRHIRSLAIASSVMLCISSTQAQSTLTWDAGGGGGAITNGGGAWLGANLWNNGGVAATWASGDNAIFGGVNTAGGAVTLASPTTVGTLTFNQFSGTYTLGTTGQALTINGGITKNSSSATVTFASPIILGGEQTWTNNSTTAINLNAALTLDGDLTFGGSGNMVMNSASAIIGGTGDLIKNGSGNISHGSNTPAHNFTGNLIVNGGSISAQSFSWLTGRNTQLTDGYLGGRFSSGYTWTSGLGTGANQIQITGGTSGFSGEGNNGSAFQVGSAGSTLKWGASTENGATGFFNPTVFLANGTANMNANGKGSLNNGIDLNGTNRTITSTHNTDGAATSGFTISGVISNTAGTAGFEKTGVGNLILGNSANTFNGTLKITGGWITAGSSGALGGASNTIEFNGGTLRATGTITSPSTRAVTMTQTGIFDTNSQAISIAGDIGGAGGLRKISNGTLTLSGTNDYTGPTTLSAGTLSVGAANNLGAAASNLIIAGGTLQISGTSLNTYSGLGRTVVINPGSTLALDISNAANTFTFDASLPEAGLALAGAGTVAFQNTVSSLTLNPQSGNSYTYSGVIADGAAGMDLVKTGAGTQTLQGNNTYTGVTVLTNGILNLSGAAGALTGTTGITFNGGGLTLTNADNDTEDGFDRIGDSVAITSNGGTITYTNTTAASARTFIETLGSVALNNGQLNLVNSLDKSAGSQTLALSGLTRTGATNSSVITFSNAGGLNLTNDRIRVNGITDDTAADQIIGAWATVGTAANSQTDYAVYDSDGANGFVVARNVAGSTQDLWSTAANTYTNALAAQTLTGTRSITALRNTGTTATLTLATGNNLETYGVLNGAATRFTIAPGTGGVLTTPTGGGGLYLTTHGINTDTQGAHNGISVTAPINNNGVDAVTLVKSGVGVLQLNATSNYSGGTVLNSGTLWAQTAASLGEVNGDITFGGSASLVLAPNNGTSGYTYTLPSTRSIIVNDGAMATIAGGRAGATITINGDISGSGGVTTGRVALLSNGGVGTVWAFNLLGNNTFTGAFGVGNGGETSAGAGLAGVTINSLADSTSPITLNFGSGAFFSLGSSATANLSVPNRPVNLLNSNITIRNQDANNTMTLGSVSTSTASAQTLKLGDGGFGGFIDGSITNGAGSIAVTKSGSGKWTLSNSLNSYTGATTISAGTLEIQGSVASSSNISNSGTLIFNNASAQSYGNAISGTGTLTKNGAGTFTLAGTNSYSGSTTVSAGTLLVNGSTAAGSTVGVSLGATLGGTGTINGAVNVSGVLSPGASIETLGTGTLSLASGSSLLHELDSSVATSVGSDLLKVTGNLNLAGTVGLTLSDFATTDVAFNVNDVFSVINYTGTWNGGLFTFEGNELADAEEFTFGLNTWRINYAAATGGSNFVDEHVAGSFVNLTVLTAVPEPSSVALLGTLGAMMLLRRRR
jgi:autotransporter-associated beta strand protein